MSFRQQTKVTRVSAYQQKRPKPCQWCGTAVASQGRGRPRKYCSTSCKQRAYEQRQNLSGTEISPDAVILSKAKADMLHDSLFQLRCAAEDIAWAAAEEASAEELGQLCTELIDLARSIEKLR